VSLVRAFDDRLGLRRPILVGHSLGAAVAVATALWHRTDIRAIVLVDGDALAIRCAPRWAPDLLVGPWVTALYRNGIPGFRLSDLRSVHARALVIWGDRDTVDAVAAGRRSAAALGAPFRTLAGAGHLSMLAAPVGLTRAIDAFARG
jgi:pimeloyl-ACP methyl ester carboxylesterase